ncbi:MAG TPA: heparinase II/III family protein [Terracidiphilus sp.]|nr:heparinase II/III family protein [Terracidiphilus sp.]
MKLHLSAFVLIAFGFTSTLSIAQAPPHILLGKAEFVRLNELARTQPWAAKQREAIIQQAAAFPESYERRFGLNSVELPPEGGQWLHYYACPDTGSLLVFHPPDQNICPDTGQVFKGYPYDHVVYMLRADALEKGALASALAYRLTGDHADAEKGALILKLYADKYLTYPMHDNSGKESQFGARVYSQTLDESIWLIDLSWTYDLLRDTDVFTPEDRSHIERDLLYAGAMTVSRANMGPTDNIQSWILGAEATVGFTLDDKTLIDQAIDGPHGFRSQMKEFVNDGFWIEGAWGYQFYALRPLELVAQMSTRAGVDLWKQEPNLGALLASPLGVMLPDGSLPAFNDSHSVDLYEEAFLYEPAYAALKNPDFAAIDEHVQRANREAFLFGVPSIEGASLPMPKSAVFPHAGYATLRAPTGDLTEIVKFGPHGGGHGHFDKLNEVIFAKGGMMSVDPGTHFYGIPIHQSWDKMTVAHNTLSVDEAAQKPATGKLLSWQAEPEFTAVTADAGPVYDNVDLQRTSVVTSDYVLEITTAKSTDGKEHDFDWNYHNFGVQHADGAFSTYSGFPQRDGYQNLMESQSATISGDFHTVFAMDKDRQMNLWMLGGGSQSQVFTGLGSGPDLRVKVPYVIVRRHGPSAQFIAVLEPGPAAARIVGVTNADGKIHIRGAGWEDTIELGAKTAFHHAVLQ